MPSQLEQLGSASIIVADSAEFLRLAQFTPQGAVCTRLGVVAALQLPAYAPLMAQTATAHRGQPADAVVDRLLVRFGCELLAAVAGRVCTEVDARLAFDAAGTLACALRLVALYASEGVPRERVMLDIAATWEGVQAAKALAHQGIASNLSLVFGACQAVAAAEAGAAQIAPPVREFGDVAVVADMWRYFKKFGLDTEIMACGFHDTRAVLALAGCDRLALEPALMGQLAASEAPAPRQLDPEAARGCDVKAASYNEPSFRWALNQDALANERLAAGVRERARGAAELELRARAA